MSIRTPPTLLQLAAESLLRDQATAIAALEYLPAELFLPLFYQAYYGRRYQSVKAMAQAWPYTVLHLSGLPQLTLDQSFKALLDGLDFLLAKEVPPRRRKLRVLDLRFMSVGFRRMCCGASTQKHSPTGPMTMHSFSPNMEHPFTPLEVFLDLNFNESDRDKFFMYIIQWAQQREGLLHLCCKTLSIAEVPFQRLRKVLDAVQLDCIQEVEVNCTWDLPTLGMFALYLGQMRNLQRLSLSHIDMLMEQWEEAQDEVEQEAMEQEEEQAWERNQQEEQECFSQFLSQMLRLQHFCELNMNSPSFLQGRLDQLLRCLQNPLDKLVITQGQRLTHSDLTHLFQCQKLTRLKFLHLYCVSLEDFSPEPLRALLEAVAPTRQNLGLDNCAMVNSQFEAILPVLSLCHRLREFSITENNCSVATLGNLLRHTAGLHSLELELYPFPVESYRTQGSVNQDRLALIQAYLTGILRELGHPRTILLANKNCGHWKICDVTFS